MGNLNKYVTIKYKSHQELNEKINELNKEGWEVVSVFDGDEKNKKNILLKKEDVDNDKQILHG